MPSFDYDAKKNEKKREANADIQEKRLVQKIERPFSPMEIFSFKQGVLGENSLRYNMKMKSLRIRRDKSSAQEIKIIDFDNLNAVDHPKKRTRTTGQSTKQVLIDK